MIATLCAAVLFAFQFGLLVALLWGRSRMTRLPALKTAPRPWPQVSLIIPARNEEKTLERGMQSLLQIDYPNLEFIVVNDRSTDKTGELIRRLAKQDSRVRSLTVEKLPSHWLGKNHALQFATQQSRGELLLFTDADVEMSPPLLKRAVQLLLDDKRDHLTALPEIISPDWKLLPVLGTFFISFTIFTRPWKAKDPKSSLALGVGAFNMIRRSAYDSIGGHTPIRMRPDDDLALGRLVKSKGLRTDCIEGAGHLRVEWYPSLWELVRGLEKNSLSAFDYSPWRAAGGLLLNVIFFALPFALPFIVSGAAQVIALLALASLLANYAFHLKSNRLPLWCTPLLPLAGIFLCFTLVRSVLLAYWRGGIYWRGTFYSLTELKSHR